MARRQHLVLALALALAAGLLPAATGRVDAAVSGARATVRETQSPAQSVFQRCQRAMVQGVCRVMTGDGAGAAMPTASRVFVAGTGEVDAAAYAELRRHGDAMCGQVQRQCEADWQGSACRIARALYPELP
jgi:hypothetical protein